MYYLYLKTHNITGLKYLGITTKNPVIYKGSGKYWLLHLNKHGNDVSTEILGQYDTKEELKEAGLYYSKLWNIVESDSFANLAPEKGGGGEGIMSLSFERRKELSSKAYKASLLSRDPEERKQTAKRIGSSLYITKKGIFDPKYNEIKKQWAKKAGNTPSNTRGKVGGSIVGHFIWVNNGIINNRIPPEHLDDFIINGYIRGRK